MGESMSVEINVTVTAKIPPSLDVSVEMPYECPADPFHQQRWTEELERRVQFQLDEIDQLGSPPETYLAEYMNEYAGGYDIAVREDPSYGPSFLTPEEIEEANRL
jgi:hypothetical protein